MTFILSLLMTLGFLAVIALFAVIRFIWRFSTDHTYRCRHDWKLERTNSFGAKAWYRCTKCDKESLH